MNDDDVRGIALGPPDTFVEGALESEPAPPSALDRDVRDSLVRIGGRHALVKAALRIREVAEEAYESGRYQRWRAFCKAIEIMDRTREEIR